MIYLIDFENVHEEGFQLIEGSGTGGDDGSGGGAELQLLVRFLLEGLELLIGAGEIQGEGDAGGLGFLGDAGGGIEGLQERVFLGKLLKER